MELNSCTLVRGPFISEEIYKRGRSRIDRITFFLQNSSSNGQGRCYHDPPCKLGKRNSRLRLHHSNNHV